MKTRYWLLIILAVLLGGLSLYFNTDWFKSDTIQIYHRAQAVRTGLFRRRRPAPPPPPQTSIFFGFDRKLKLTEVQVQSLQEILTNKYPHAFWHLVTDSNSPPTQGFTYGTTIPGMRPYFKNAEPERLVPGVKYRLLIEAGSVKAQHDFQIAEAAP